MKTKAPAVKKPEEYTITFETFMGLPGCCGIDVVSGLSVGLVTKQREAVNWERVCRSVSSNTLIASTTQEQTAVNLLLEATPGWTVETLPENPNTGNTLFLWVYNSIDPVGYDDEDEEDEEDF